MSDRNPDGSSNQIPDGLRVPELNARGIPFIFLTGYDRAVIDRRYSDAPLLQKPVDEQTLQRALAAFLDTATTALIRVDIEEVVHVSGFQRVTVWKPGPGRA